MNIDIISDVICPWCYIGKRRLEQALAMAPQPELQLNWRPFQLNPDMPDEGMERVAYMQAKFGSSGGRMHDRLIAIGHDVGIPFAFDRITRMPNTILAHRLSRYAARHGKQSETVEAMFRAYFTDGADIGNVETLAALASGVGMDSAAAENYLAGNEDAETIRSEDKFAREMGITGVPCFIVDQQYALSGAQEPPAFLEVFAMARNGGTAPPDV